ncbi:uncharacterized protein EKO05_0005622 [Ascochyta rabiei]|uniref:Catalytic n=1 Tax=Didymella rabiei TaxID=5454 RepID=A0A163FGS1_DIDRA|nr:uncharacterized protein EKO05_0005622 [Ascochyta rabiei]KZM24353.1 catalytic [Ascochyta rabiei]UPX15165.1 hypothetical protein EKO05_0005622 [Ascochyta rabiei]
MAQSNGTQLAIILSLFFLPILTYLYFTRAQPKKSNAGPLPPPTEITALYIHPIKSCHGIKVQSAKLLLTGLDLDRQWMWVTADDYKFLTIRQNAKMTLIRPSYDAETDILTVTAPAPNSIDEKLEFSIPAHPTSEWLASNTERHEVEIWNQSTPAQVYSTKLTGPFNDFFGRQVRLVYKSPECPEPRALRSNGAAELLGRNASTCFPDLMPVLVASQSSIDELNSRIRSAETSELELELDVRRFRPNVLVRGQPSAPWDEDRWKTLRISSAGKTVADLDVTQRCARCHVPNVDPETAEEHKRQPWDTLMKYRRIDAGITYKPCYGMLCVPREGAEIKVGMQLEVTEVTDQHRYKAGF